MYKLHALLVSVTMICARTEIYTAAAWGSLLDSFAKLTTRANGQAVLHSHNQYGVGARGRTTCQSKSHFPFLT